MRIDELIKKPISDFRKENLTNYMKVDKFLNKHGFYVVGAGMSGTVYHHEKLNYLLKIFSNNDRAYPIFVNYALNNPSLYVPKFKGKLIKLTNQYSAIRLEKLKDTNKNMVTQIVGFFNIYFSYLYATEEAKNNKDNQKAFLDNKKQIEENFPGLFDVIEDITSLKIYYNLSFDLHVKNIMWRDTTNTPVFIDPLAGYTDE